MLRSRGSPLPSSTRHAAARGVRGIFLLTSGALPQTKLMPTGLEIDAERIKVARLVQQDRIAAIAGELGIKSMQ